MTAAVLFHADPSMRARYEAALPGVRLTIILSRGSQFSAGFDVPNGFAGQYKTLPALLAKFDPQWREGEPLVLMGFSAGCFALRAYLRSAEDRARVTAAVFLDGLHAGGSDKLADAGPLAGVVEYAREVWTSFGAKALVISHTQIVPPGYASTRATADRLLSELGIQRPSRLEAVDVGGVSVRPYAGGDKTAHARQLQVVGPELLRELVAPVLAGPPTPAPPAPPEPPPPPADGPRELPSTLTPASPAEVAQALARAWQTVLGSPPPTANAVRLLLAQWAIETGRGKSMHAWNLGNVKGREGDGRGWQFFACNERLSPAQAASAIKVAKPRTDGKPGLDAVITGSSGGKTTVWFYPSHPTARFRAFASLDAGAADYLELLHRRFAPAWPAVLAGDPVAFVKALAGAGYFTADVASYTKAVVSLFNEFQGVAVDLGGAAPPANDCDPRTLGERAVDWSLEQLRAGVREVPPGSNGGPAIAAYFRPCRRAGSEKLLGITSGNWCCAGACAAMAAAARPGELLPHGYRAGVVELVQDLVDRGLWRPVALVRAGGYTPRRGDVAIYDRSTPGKPETSWFRHINRLTEWRGDGTFQTIGGNEGDGWALAEHRVDEARLLGFGAYPAAGVTCEAHDDPALASLDADVAAAEGGERVA